MLNGRRAGAVFVLGQRTVIGRAGHVDIQLVHETVSRQHARLTIDEHGDVVLTDLSSDNGTFVNGESVSRRVLRPGDTICVADTRFVYEETDHDPALRSSQAFAQRATSTESLRQTAPHRIVLSEGEEAAKDPSAGQYLRQPDVGQRRRERVKTPSRGIVPGQRAAGRDRATPASTPATGPTRAAAAPERPTEREPAAPQRVVADPGSASRMFATGAPSDSEDPTYPIALGPPWVPAAPEPDQVRARADAPTRPEPKAGGKARVTAEYAAGDTVAVPSPSTTTPFDRSAPRHAFRRRATAEYGSSWNDETSSDPFDPGETYGADALVDVLAYRHLRLRMLRGDPLDSRDRTRFQALERRLEHDPEEGEDLALQRRFHRFACNLPLRIGRDQALRGAAHPGRMLDLSAGGAQIEIAGAPIEAGDTVWLSLSLPGLDRVLANASPMQGVVIEARVIWASPEGDRIGLIFAGGAAFTEA